MCYRGMQNIIIASDTATIDSMISYLSGFFLFNQIVDESLVTKNGGN